MVRTTSLRLPALFLFCSVLFFFVSPVFSIITPPPKCFLFCWNGKYGNDAHVNDTYCGLDFNNCRCPDGYQYVKQYTINKRVHRNSPPSIGTLNKDAAKRVHSKAAAEPTYDFTNTLKGEWDDVVGYVGFNFKNNNNNKEYIVCLIGLPVESLGNNEYQSTGWDKKIFWLDVGDGAPMHVCAIYAPNYVEDGVAYDNVYWAPNFMYLPPGETDNKKMRNCDLWMFLNDDDVVEEVWLDLYDENWEITDTKQLKIGDQVQAFTPLIDMSEPGSFFAMSLEDRFQTVKNEPLFLYEHMTPNIDFPNEMSKGFDFENVDLLYILYAENFKEDDVYQFSYSTPKVVNLKWGDKPSKVENWFQYGMSSVINFFLPTR